MIYDTSVKWSPSQQESAWDEVAFKKEHPHYPSRCQTSKRDLLLVYLGFYILNGSNYGQ